MSSGKVVEELNIVRAFKEYPQVMVVLTREGWIDPVKIRNMEIFLEFKNLSHDIPSKMKRYYKISIRRNISVDTVRNAIREIKQSFSEPSQNCQSD